MNHKPTWIAMYRN